MGTFQSLFYHLFDCTRFYARQWSQILALASVAWVRICWFSPEERCAHHGEWQVVNFKPWYIVVLNCFLSEIIPYVFVLYSLIGEKNKIKQNVENIIYTLFPPHPVTAFLALIKYATHQILCNSYNFRAVCVRSKHPNCATKSTLSLYTFEIAPTDYFCQDYIHHLCGSKWTCCVGQFTAMIVNRSHKSVLAYGRISSWAQPGLHQMIW